MPQIFRPFADTIARIVLIAIILVPLAAIGVAYGVMRSPFITGENITLEQPVPFSHEHHVGGLKLDCRYCHSSVEKSPVAGVPPTHTCMTCHSQIFTNAPMLAPVRESLAEGKPIRWKRVHHLPAYVYFDHSVHIANGVGCSTCHGAVETMPLMRQTQPLTMSWCLDCHRNPAPNLRPLADIFKTGWRPPEDQERKGRELLQEHRIDTGHLTDCSTCHR
ncbi:cytochrome c3 family protein [Methylocystis bryophila]|uniref:Cytochrome C n=1 Tax=Methylocystis bryophila TaxID=655015 RepID=A0A1W6MQ55_9HYPH|nr:cytochrome c3 family protein [Methylocystis bryophila]ARN79717.1 cytochrome C [Methylocystis bryophila]BDV39587.1 cytochrome c [Methylocystis bryophila]